MKDKQSCAMIKDLLPLYLERLTSEETNQNVKEHLEGCSSCQSIYASMQEEISRENEQADERTEIAKEVDYLKKIRTTSRRKVSLGIGGVLLAVAVIVLVRVFVYGTPSENYRASVVAEDGYVKIEGTFWDSSSVYSHYKIVEKNGQKQLVIYATMASMWNHNGTFKIECSMDLAKEQGLVVNNQKITKSGKVISTYAADIFEKKHPYIGDMTKNSELANRIGIREELGAYKNELQTKEEPYVWTFSFQRILEESNEILFNEKMRAYAYVLLATVDNVSEIKWTYNIKTKQGMQQKAVNLTTIEAERVLGEDIKSFGNKEERVEELLIKVGLDALKDGEENVILSF